MSCAECGEEGGASLKVCKACMTVKYCNADCQKKHWATHKKECKLRAAELRDEALFKDPPPKEDCPICFLPMPDKLISCISFPPATIKSVPIYDFEMANENDNFVYQDKHKYTEEYYPCCGKSICRGCIHSFRESGNIGKCPFCNADRNKTREEQNEDLMKRVEANDAASICLLAYCCDKGLNGVQQDHAKAMELYVRAANLGYSKAHNNLGDIYRKGGDLKKAKFHFEAAAMAGYEVARYNLGMGESNDGNMARAVKHWAISASGGCYQSMHELRTLFKQGFISRESINSTLATYNNSCAEMRSEARDAFFQMVTKYAPREE
jgi:tetratricopeptide (TPR) repeat protein